MLGIVVPKCLVNGSGSSVDGSGRPLVPPVEVRVEEKRLDQAIEFPESPARSPSEPALDQRCPVPRMRSRRAAADLGALAACSVGVGNRPDFRILST